MIALFHGELYAVIKDNQIEPKKISTFGPNLENGCNFEETVLFEYIFEDLFEVILIFDSETLYCSSFFDLFVRNVINMSKRAEV
jgi:hypothetical protein